AAVLTGSVATNDSDVDKDTLTYALTAPVAGLTLAANGGYSFDAANAAYQNLAAGQTRAVVANYTVSDGKGGSAASTLTITVTGVNDAPVVTNAAAALRGAAIEAGDLDNGTAVAGTPTASGTLTATDVDLGATLVWSIVGTPSATYGAIRIDAATGVWTYTLDNARAATEALKEGETVTQTYTARVTDNAGAFVDQAIVVTINGTNDVPEVTSVVADSVGVVTEAGHLDNGTVVAGTASVSGTLTAADVDQATGLLWSAVGDRPATYGTFGINAATGVWTYTLDNALAATQALKEGEIVLQTYTARVTDSFGGFEDEAIVVSIVGTNDVPVVTNAAAALSGTVTEAGHLDNGTAVAGTPSVSGALTATDVDQATGLTWSVVGTPSATYGAIAVNAATGVWTYTLDNSLAATQALKEGEVVTQTYTVRVTDNFGAFVDQTVTVTVNGTNDVPVFAATPTVQGNEDSSGIPFTVSATDVDTDDAVTYSAPSITARGGSIVAGANGSFTYTPLPDFNGTDTVGVTATDRNGAQVTQLVTFNIASNLAETRSIDVTDDSTATTYDANGSGFTLGDNFKLTDDSTRPTNAVIVNFATGDTIEVTAASTDYSFTTVGNDLRITFTALSGVINQIVIPGVANGFVTDEASAEDVLGWDFFNALTRSGSGPVGTPGLGGDLDIDNDSNQSTTALVSAAGGNIQFTENANVANNVRITSFTAGDKITVSNADASTYSFSAVGDDLVITANEAGVVSSIVISSVVQGTSFINDLASARTALGFDFFEIAASVVPAQSVAIDNGNVAQTFQAGSGRFAFTDNTRTETNVIIQGFGADDKINVSNGTVADYSFGTGDDPNDLVITALTGTGGVNVIVLDDVLIGSGGFVFDYASAVDALGYDFMSFG
ncbi:beta strand repeat-containing protein, partial [Sandarakinorhabdus limnophila]|uniref:beta strand repeat-containing protein n=1 Tax=Sandarakinorhabdus limnophila TaxID=210512 RepID=UPI0026EF317A